MAKDTYYFSHDYNTRNDSKIKKLLSKYGYLGYGVFWAIIEDLYNNTNALPLDYDSIAYDLRCEEKMLESIINDFDLFVIEEGVFGSLSVQKRLDERNEKSVKARLSVNKRWAKDTNVLQSNNDSNTIKERKVNEIKVNEIKKEKANKLAPLPERKNNFYKKVESFLDEYDKKLLREFFDYWTEQNEGGLKMRFESQKFFDFSKRLANWKRKDNDFSKTKTVSKLGAMKDIVSSTVDNLKTKYENE